MVGSLWQFLKREHLNGVWEVNRTCQEEGGSKESNPIERRSWAKAWWHERSRCAWDNREKGHVPGGGKTWEGAEKGLKRAGGASLSRAMCAKLEMVLWKVHLVWVVYSLLGCPEKFHRPGGLNNRNVLSQSSHCQKSKSKAPAGLVPRGVSPWPADGRALPACSLSSLCESVSHFLFL